jgi:hypothetical protein
MCSEFVHLYVHCAVRQSWAIGVYTVQTQISELVNRQECSPYCTVLYTHSHLFTTTSTPRTAFPHCTVARTRISGPIESFVTGLRIRIRMRSGFNRVS